MSAVTGLVALCSAIVQEQGFLLSCLDNIQQELVHLDYWDQGRICEVENLALGSAVQRARFSQDETELLHLARIIEFYHRTPQNHPLRWHRRKLMDAAIEAVIGPP